MDEHKDRGPNTESDPEFKRPEEPIKDLEPDEGQTAQVAGGSHSIVSPRDPQSS